MVEAEHSFARSKRAFICASPQSDDLAGLDRDRGIRENGVDRGYLQQPAGFIRDLRIQAAFARKSLKNGRAQYSAFGSAFRTC